MLTENSDDFINNSSIGIHTVAANGIIEYANQCELITLGYSKEEYIGHHVSEFQIDKVCLSDMMDRLNRFEKLKNYPAKVQGKYSIKYILYNSSVYQKSGQFIHTRCFGNEIDENSYQVFRKFCPYFKES